MAQPCCVLNVSGETPVNLAHLELGLFLFVPGLAVQGCRGTSPLCSQLSQAAWITGQWGLGCRTAGHTACVMRKGIPSLWSLRGLVKFMDGVFGKPLE